MRGSFGYLAEQADEAYARAEQLRVEAKLLTFDDMLVLANDLLDDEAVLGRWSAKYDYVITDESQDTNRAQNELAAKVARSHRNFMAVGDPAQAIYAWRGARPEYLRDFAETWGAEVVGMHRNYRSGSAIVEAANRVIESSPSRLPGLVMTAERPERGQVTFDLLPDMDAEGEHVVTHLREALARGQRWRDCAVLYRVNAQSRGPEEQLLAAKIPYVVIGGTNFYDRKEVKDLLAYLRLAEGRGNADDVRRAINSPFRFLGRAFVERLMELRGSGGTWPDRVRTTAAQERIQSRQQNSAMQWADMLEVLSRGVAAGSPPASMLEQVVERTGYVDWLRGEEGEESPENSRVSNVRELVRAAGRFLTAAELLDYVDEVVKSARRAKAGADSGEQPDRVKLMSIHRSKGLEWPVVFVLGCNEGILPHGRCDDEDEERRLAYVAITRARDVCHLSAVRSAAVGAKVVELQVSRYVGEAVGGEVAGGVPDGQA